MPRNPGGVNRKFRKTAPDVDEIAAQEAHGELLGLIAGDSLMVLEHQTEMHNRITRANFGARQALRALNRYSRHQRIVDLFVTNVPGPQRPLHLLGARLLEAFPVVQVAGNVPLSVAVLSYAGQLNIGIQSDPDGCPDLDVFADGLRKSLEELSAATPPLPG